MKITDKSIMFEPWTECNNLCKFCYLGQVNRNTPDEKKIENVKKIMSLIDEHFTGIDEQYKALGLIGGEFFQGQMKNPEVKALFFEMCKKVFDLIEKDIIRDFWCYCTLTIGDQEDLYKLIDLFDKTVTDKEKHHFWILVSYDTYGRFYVPGREENWSKHMLNLQKYSFIRFNVTSIFSQDFCEKVLSGELDLIAFQKKYKTHFFFKQPTASMDFDYNEPFAKIHPNWFVKRKTFLDFLVKLKKESKDLFDSVLNIEQRADDIVQSVSDFVPTHRDKETWEETDMEPNPKCGHVTYYKCYADSDECCLCDYLKIKNQDME
ncbi:MAG: hypothetical protein J5691_00425 [Bacilli bacterium]|nr:hypothetical protein [Bacilli bacterium]